MDFQFRVTKLSCIPFLRSIFRRIRIRGIFFYRVYFKFIVLDISQGIESRNDSFGFVVVLELRSKYICAKRMQPAFYGRPMQPILIRAPVLTPSTTFSTRYNDFYNQISFPLAQTPSSIISNLPRESQFTTWLETPLKVLQLTRSIPSFDSKESSKSESSNY